MTATEIQELRASYGITQGSLADILGVNGVTVSKWERGVLALPTGSGHAHRLLLIMQQQPADQRTELGQALQQELALGGGLAALRKILGWMPQHGA